MPVKRSGSSSFATPVTVRLTVSQWQKLMYILAERRRKDTAWCKSTASDAIREMIESEYRSLRGVEA